MHEGKVAVRSEYSERKGSLAAMGSHPAPDILKRIGVRLPCVGDHRSGPIKLNDPVHIPCPA
jgi:hypothetical protein